MTKELRGIAAALAAFGNAYGKGTGTRKAVQVSSGADRSRPKSAVGKSQSESGKIRYGCSGPQEDTLGSCAKEDRRCAEGAMGKGQGSEEDGLTFWADQQGESRPRQRLERRLPCGRRRPGGPVRRRALTH